MQLTFDLSSLKLFCRRWRKYWKATSSCCPTTFVFVCALTSYEEKKACSKQTLQAGRKKQCQNISSDREKWKVDDRWDMGCSWLHMEAVPRVIVCASLTIWCHLCVQCSVSAAARPHWTGQPLKRWNTLFLRWATSKGWSDSLGRGNRNWTFTKVKGQNTNNIQTYSSMSW